MTWFMSNQLNIHNLASLKPQQYVFGSFLFLRSSFVPKRRAAVYCIVSCIVEIQYSMHFGKWAPICIVTWKDLTHIETIIKN